MPEGIILSANSKGQLIPFYHQTDNLESDLHLPQITDLQIKENKTKYKKLFHSHSSNHLMNDMSSSSPEIHFYSAIPRSLTADDVFEHFLMYVRGNQVYTLHERTTLGHQLMVFRDEVQGKIETYVRDNVKKMKMFRFVFPILMDALIDETTLCLRQIRLNETEIQIAGLDVRHLAKMNWSDVIHLMFDSL